MMHTPMKSEMSVNVTSSNEMIPYKTAQKADVDSSTYPTKGYRKRHGNHNNNNNINYQQNENAGSGTTSPRRRFQGQQINSNNNNNNNNNVNGNRRITGGNSQSRRNSANDTNTNNNNSAGKNPPKPKEQQQQKPGKSLKSDQDSQEPSPAPSQRSISPAPSCSSNGYNHRPSSHPGNGEESKKPSVKNAYSQEFMHLVRQQMENINLTPSKNGKYPTYQQNGNAHKNGDVDLNALRSALSGIMNENYLYYGQYYTNPSLHNTPQKQQHPVLHGYGHGQFVRGPPLHQQHHYPQNGYRSSYYNRNYHQEEQPVCKCAYANRNGNSIFCSHCRYPVKRSVSNQNGSYNSNKNNRFNRNNTYNNSYQNSNRNNGATTYRNTKNRQDSHETGSSGSNDSFNGRYSNRHYNNQRNYGYSHSQNAPKSLSPTPTPSSSSKSESPTGDNPQNDSGSAKSITFGNFDLPSDDFSSSNSSSSGSSTSLQTQPSQNQPEAEIFARPQLQTQHTQTQVQQQDIYVQETQYQPQSPISIGFWVNYPPFQQSAYGPPYPSMHPYQAAALAAAQQQQQWSNGPCEPDNQNNQKRRPSGRVSPNMYPTTIPLTLSAPLPNYISNNSTMNPRKSPPLNGIRIPPLPSPQDNPNSVCPSDRFLARAHQVEIKETPSQLLNNSEWDALSQSIWNKFLKSQQTEETYRNKILVWRQLNTIIKKDFLEKSHPKNGLYLVGSTISGFGADGSDIDMCLVANKTMSSDPRYEAVLHLSSLQSHIMKESNAFQQFSLIQARVPILRFKDSSHLLEVDLNWNNSVGIRNTHLLYCYSQMDWRVRPLALVVKLWAQHHNINDARNMTISSYSLVLMVIHFLQFGVSVPILPCLHKMYPDKFQFCHDISNIDMIEEMEPIHSDNTQPLGELFLEFLNYYSNFEYSKYAISIRTGSVMPIDECKIVRNYKNDPNHWKTLCIEEPFDLTNTARSVYDEEVFEKIKNVFFLSWCRLREKNDLNSVFAEPLFYHHMNGMYQMPPTPAASPTTSLHQHGDGLARMETKLS